MHAVRFGACATFVCSRFSSAAFEAGKEYDFAIWFNGLEPAVIVGTSVDRHRDPSIKLGLEAGVLDREAIEEFAQVGGVDLDLTLVIGEAGEGAPEFDLDHGCGLGLEAPGQARVTFLYWSFIALSTLGGDMGNCVMRTPAASDTALAMAAKGGTMEVSPTPRTP